MLSDRQEVQLHTLLTLYCCTLCQQTICWPLFEVLTFLFLLIISLVIKKGDLFTHYITWYSYLYGLMDFSITYPHRLTLKGILALYKCVWSASHYTCIALGEITEYQLNRVLDGLEIGPGSPEEVKNLLTLPGT